MITVDGLNFIDDDTHVRNGFTVESWDGWSNGVDMDRDVEQRAQAHGADAVDGHMALRLVTISGKCYAEDPDRMHNLETQFSGLLASGGFGTITVQQGGRTRWAECGRYGVPRFDPLVWGETATYQLQLVLPEPYKYGQHFSLSGTAAVMRQLGNFESWPKVTVTGSGVYSVTGPTGAYEVNDPLGAGDVDVIDMATGYRTRNGVVVYGGIAQAHTWSIPKGGTEILSVVAGTVTGVWDWDEVFV